ncbi:MAG: hypothetical protein IKR73_04575 [Oscillospiraceae bacterium]|nr:hypothetical protein [Oscillospiraceae bacterium]
MSTILVDKYNEIMGHIKITDEMRERIIGNIGRRQERGRMKTALIWISAAACLVIAIGAMMVLNGKQLIQTPPETTNGQGTRDDPNKSVTAEVFMERFGSIVSVPDDIEILEYKIDSEIDRGYIAFYKDEVLWNVYVKPKNIWPEVYGLYVTEDMKELPCTLDEGQVTKIHGVAPELHYFRSDTIDRYELYAKWDLEEDGYQIAFMSFSETPIHTLPVEVIK